MMQLQPLTREAIVPGIVVIEIGDSSASEGLQTNIQLGRVIEGTIRPAPLEGALENGMFVVFDILEPEEYSRARVLIYNTFFASRPRPADWPAPGVYAWPELMPLTFNEQRSAGWRKHIQIR